GRLRGASGLPPSRPGRRGLPGPGALVGPVAAAVLLRAAARGRAGAPGLHPGIAGDQSAPGLLVLLPERRRVLPQRPDLRRALGADHAERRIAVSLRARRVPSHERARGRLATISAVRAARARASARRS